ncbi:hypothetical protein TI04_02635 [Achromatium sp. WMS2]|nr:hypothetical protein TI04_02635 [Achromatium sp. WMS2]
MTKVSRVISSCALLFVQLLIVLAQATPSAEPDNTQVGQSCLVAGCFWQDAEYGTNSSNFTKMNSYNTKELTIINQRLTDFDQTHRVLIKQMRLAGPQFFKFYPMAGIWERDLIVGNWVDVDSSSDVLDWQCGKASYNGHDAHDVGLGYLWPWESMDIGWPIFAALDGVVADAHDGEDDRNTSCTGQSNYVILEHGNQHTWYFHLKKSSISVIIGQHVKAGQQIGLVGSSGCSSGPHLHWRTDNDGTPYESFSGPCRSGDSGWKQQPSYNSNTYIYQLVPTVNGVNSGTVITGNQLVGIKYAIANLPANSFWHFRYRRPDGSVAAIYGPQNINNASPYRNSVWMYHWWVNFNVTGSWNVDLLVNNVVVGTAPILVVSSSGEIANRPPPAVTISFDSPALLPESIIFCKVDEPWLIRDPDGDFVSYRYRWTVNGAVIRDVISPALADAIPHQSITDGDVLACEVTPDDGKISGPLTKITAFPLAVIKTDVSKGTIISSPSGIDCGTVCAANFTSNSPVILNATPNAGSNFTGWSGACTGAATNCTVIMDAAKTVTATFNSNNYAVTPNIGTGGTVTPNTTQIVAANTTKSFTVTPKPGYINQSVFGTCPLGLWNSNIWTTGKITANCAVKFNFFCTACMPSGNWKAILAK